MVFRGSGNGVHSPLTENKGKTILHDFHDGRWRAELVTILHGSGATTPLRRKQSAHVVVLLR